MSAVVCPSCSTAYDDPTQRFCGKCGSDMGSRTQIRSPDTSSSERMTVSSGGGAPTGETPEDPWEGRVVDGRYRVLGKLGQGGMGAVYRVEHVKMGKIAAMKLIHPAHTDDKDVGRRFKREAEAVSRLSHPNTVQVFDFGEYQGALYLVMELVRGEDLGVLIRREGPLPFPRTAALLSQVCEALGEAHELGIIHRDLKPENLMVSRSRSGRELVKVLDFGLAKLRDHNGEEQNRVTQRGSLIGTPYYMSPEQIRADDLDARSDIYSLGAVAYRMLTGEHPFEGATPVAVLTKHLTETLVAPSQRTPQAGIAAQHERVVMRAMARDREERYASADELRRALEQALASTGELSIADLRPARQRRQTDSSIAPLPTATPTPPSSQPPVLSMRREDFDAYEQHLRRRKWLGALLLPALGLALAGGAWWVLRAPRPTTIEKEPNDTAARANPLGAGVVVKGMIGRRIALEESDRDFYQLRVPPGEHALKASVTGIPGMDLKLELHAPTGEELAAADNAGPGEGERIPATRIGPGEHYLSVREVWIAGRMATENVSDSYELVATLEPIAPEQEYEPDDTPDAARPLALDTPLTGTLGRLNDRDCFYLRGDGGGKLSGSLTAIEGVETRIVVLPRGAQLAGDGSPPKGARVFAGRGPGSPVSFAGVDWPAGTPGPIVMVERRDKPRGERDAPAPAPAGLATAYQLTVKLE